MKRPVPSDGDQRPWRHEDDGRREQYDALARCDDTPDDECGALDPYAKARDALIHIDDNDAKRVVLDGKVVLDQITTKPDQWNRLSHDPTTGKWITKKELLIRLLEKNRLLYEKEKVRLEGDAQQRLIDTELGARRCHIQNPPAYTLDHCLQILVSKKSYERIYSQMILDIREEFYEALANKEMGKARWIILRGYASVLSALFMQLRFIGVVIRALRGS